jgi:tetratricopeptide (TPR) repeat protein
MSRYAVAHLDEIDEISDGRCPSRPVRSHFGITSFGVNAWTAREAGDRIINEHDEAEVGDGQEELYLVQRGRAGSSSTASVWRRPQAPSSSSAPASSERPSPRSRGRRSLPSVARRGRHTSPVASRWAPLGPLYEAGEYAEAADRGRELIKAHPEYPLLLYNVACCERLAGRMADAIEHLRFAIERADRFRSLAADDSDFDPIRDDPAFKELVG